MKISFESFEPFVPIIQTETSPHGFTLLASFKFKLLSAFWMFNGIVDYLEEKKALYFILGIFDYCTLGIPFLISFGWSWAIRQENPLVKYGLGFLIGLVHIPVEAVRIIASIVFALNPLTLLVAGMVHLVSEFLADGKALKEAAANLQLTDENGKNSCSLKDEFNAFANRTIPIFEPFDTLWIKVRTDGEGRKLLEIKQHVSGKQEPDGSKVCYLPILSENSAEPVNYNNLAALQALIKLNAGGVTRRLEEAKEGKALLTKIMAASPQSRAVRC